MFGDDHGVAVGRDIEHPARSDAEVEAAEQWQVAGFGDDQLAVGVADVPGQFLPASGGVDADQGGAGQGGATEPQRELGHVVEQDPDMEGRAVDPEVLQQ